MKRYILSALSALVAVGSFAPVTQAFETDILRQAEGIEALSQVPLSENSSDREALGQYAEHDFFRFRRRRHRRHYRRHHSPHFRHHRH